MTESDKEIFENCSCNFLECEVYTLADAENLPECDLSAQLLRIAVRKGELPGRSFGNVYVVTRHHLREYMKTRSKPVGRPRTNNESKEQGKRTT